MTGAMAPIQPGDILRVGRGFPRSREDPELVDFLRVHYETSSPGLAHIIAVGTDGMLFELWGHRFRTPLKPDDPTLRPLGPLARRLAPERLGEALLRRDVAAGMVDPDGTPPAPRQPIVRWWLKTTRGPLPILDVIGGRVRPPLLRKAKARLLYRLHRLGMFPGMPGFLDHGVLVDRLHVQGTLRYGGRSRHIRMDRILLHKNHSLHLVALDLDCGEQRSFRLDRMYALDIPGLGAVDLDSLYWELQSLCMSRTAWLRSWNRLRHGQGLPPGPPVGLIGRTLDRLTAALTRPRRPRPPPWWRRQLSETWDNLLWWARTTPTPTIRHLVAVFDPPPVPPPAPPIRDHRPLEARPWRRRLVRAVESLQSGGHDQVTALLPMNALLKQQPAHCWAYLRHLLALALRDAEAEDTCDPLTRQVLREAVALPLTPTRRSIRAAEARARQVLTHIDDRHPGWKRVQVRAMRPKVSDARLLLCETYVSALLDRWDRQAGAVPGLGGDAPTPWTFYRAGCYSVAHWDDLRFRMDASCVPKIQAIIQWWDAALSASP